MYVLPCVIFLVWASLNEIMYSSPQASINGIINCGTVSGILLVTSSPLSCVRVTSPLMIDCAPQASIDEIMNDACGDTLKNLFIMIHWPGISKFTCCFSVDHFVVFHVQ